MDDSKKIVRTLTTVFAVEVSTDDIDDIMVSALEGGINYWCDCAGVIEEKRVADWGHEQIARGGCLKIHVIEPFDDDDTEWYLLTLDKFMRGLRMWLEWHPGALCGECGLYHPDCGNIDAAGADCIVQYALFGEVVYG